MPWHEVEKGKKQRWVNGWSMGTERGIGHRTL